LPARAPTLASVPCHLRDFPSFPPRFDGGALRQHLPSRPELDSVAILTALRLLSVHDSIAAARDHPRHRRRVAGDTPKNFIAWWLLTRGVMGFTSSHYIVHASAAAPLPSA
jgi:hypothetical protein